MSVDFLVPPLLLPSVAAFTFGIHRENGVRSDTSLTYQILFAASQRAPSALAVSFSGYGTFKSILMGELSAPCTGFTAFATLGLPGAQTVCLWRAWRLLAVSATDLPVLRRRQGCVTVSGTAQAGSQGDGQEDRRIYGAVGPGADSIGADRCSAKTSTPLTFKKASIVSTTVRDLNTIPRSIISCCFAIG